MTANDADTIRELNEKVDFCREVDHPLLRVARIQPATRNPQDLLDPANWRSDTWITGDTPGITLGLSACGYHEDAKTEWGFHPLDGLADYFKRREADLDGCVIIVMDAYEADEKDVDHEQGAILVWPQRIVSVTPVEDTPLAELIAEREGGW